MESVTESITRFVRNNDELKETIESFFPTFNHSSLSPNLLEVTVLEDGNIQLDVPIEACTDEGNSRKLFVAYVKDDGIPKPIEHLSKLMESINSSALQACTSSDANCSVIELPNGGIVEGVNPLTLHEHDPNSGWENVDCSVIELPDNEILLQSLVQKTRVKEGTTGVCYTKLPS